MSTKEEIKDRLRKLAPVFVAARTGYGGPTDVWEGACEAFAEALAENATVLYARDGFWCVTQGQSDTKNALLIDVQEIERGVSKAEVLKAVRELEDKLGLMNWMELEISTREIGDRIERFGIRQEKV